MADSYKVVDHALTLDVSILQKITILFNNSLMGLSLAQPNTDMLKCTSDPEYRPRSDLNFLTWCIIETARFTFMWNFP